MLALRILGFPIALAAFAILYVIATKAPEAVEVTNIILWLLLPVIVIAKLGQKLLNRKQEN
ncbi:hypothetical protein GGE43_002533 [Agrobacterium tumefaciens]|uniref:Transmembrane protein n=1 Tax=Agrobacterium radiobacter TaxID=362 RepID=A0ABR6J901_AGRRD|nr:hypothetical protein [Agrobacterium radiobacter]TGE79027.1 hypothetical protein C9410_12825 [Rhizobium sp. SEMIA 439]MBB4282620.1 hypothetical protein [Agrobacterium radiobacter]MBB4318778.1 hypothetical protein [Agrobacterium radiobacter]MBB4324046.1 hypothetical protein [Agrobacterium radiobacter]MBB4336316.1 hypothetical protein [Agrobacterium radiobacter]